jgi:hypothetical protein
MGNDEVVSTLEEFPAHDLRWEQVGTLRNCTYACLGDPAADDGQRPRTGSGAGWVWRSQFGLGFIGGIPHGPEVAIEVGRRSGVAVGARVHFTPRLDEIEAGGDGRWRAHGEVRCSQVVAWDEHDYPDPGSLHELPLDAGEYGIELFDFNGEALGLRLVATV